MNAVGASILALLVGLVLFAPRRWALLGMMAGALYLTKSQVIEVFGLNVYAVRCLELVGFIRVMVRKEFSFSKANAIDKALLLVYAYTTVTFLLRSILGDGMSSGIAQVSTADKIGLLADAILCYFAFRGLLGSIGDFVWLLRSLAILLGPYVVLVSIERLTGQNPFAVLGGMPEVWEDGNRIRCRGSFGHPSLLGTFGASLLPLYIGLAFTKDNRLHALAGIGLCLGIVFLSNSGGPLTFVALGIAGWLLWTMRTRMFIVRRAMVGMLVLLALVMKAPVWYLPDRVSALVGGDGWHRSYLMDQAFTHIDQWWLVGMPLAQTRDWFPYLVMGGADITNLYVALGLDAGLLAVGFFILLLVRAFRSLGRALAAVRRSSHMPTDTEFLLWGLGVMLSGHIGNFLAITYFDQTYVVWFMQLAAISTLARSYAERKIGSARNDHLSTILFTCPR